VLTETANPSNQHPHGVRGVWRALRQRLGLAKQQPEAEPNERDCVELGEKEMEIVRRMEDPNDPIGKRRRLTPLPKDSVAASPK
jgi:hypothetical protein